MKKIKTTTHFLSEVNFEKKQSLIAFLDDYEKAVKFYVNFLWNNEIQYKTISDNKEVVRTLNIKKDLLDCPQYISTTDITLDYPSKLSARALKSAANQACGIIKSAIKTRSKLLFIRNKLLSEKKRTRSITNKINKTKLVFPDIKNINAELCSTTCKISYFNQNHFDYMITLFSIGKEYGKIEIPIKSHKHSKRMSDKTNARIMSSFLISRDRISIRWEYEVPDLKNKSVDKDSEPVEIVKIGVDTGITDIATFSNGQTTERENIHGYSLAKILHIIERRKKGSKSFRKALDHRDNFIRWSLNKLNFSGIDQINLEKVSNFRYGKNVGKFLNYSGEALIREVLKDLASEHGVHVHLQNSSYRSQRCSCCGFVSRKNRSGKLFSCKRCLFEADADYNASCNHEQDLPSANFIRHFKEKKKEFFWKKNGFFDLEGKEFTVPCKEKI